MLIFKGAFILFLSTFVLSVSSRVTKDINSLNVGLACLYFISGAFAGKILYDRFQHIQILGSLTPNPNVTLYVNKIASVSAIILSVGFLSYLFVFLFKGDDHSLKALNILLCGVGTLYMWLQCLLTTYISTLFYEKRLSILRQCLVNLSFLFLVLLAIFGTLSVFLPEGDTSVLYICDILTSLSSYVITTTFLTFILSYEKEYKYFSEGLRSDTLIDDDCSLNNSSIESLLSNHTIRRLLPETSVS